MAAELSKDNILSFKSTTKGISKDRNGNVVGERLQLGMTTEQAQALIAEITAKLDNPQGVKLDFHVRKKTNTNTGLDFDSTFGFVKAVGLGGAGAQPGSVGIAPKQFAPRTAAADVAKSMAKGK